MRCTPWASAPPSISIPSSVPCRRCWRPPPKTLKSPRHRCSRKRPHANRRKDHPMNAESRYAHDMRPTLSVIVPCYNEAEVITATHVRLKRALVATGVSFEILYVNDGSRDATGTILAGLQADD